MSTAEADANALTAKMGDRLDSVVEEHNLGGAAGGSHGARKLAADMRKSVAKDIKRIAGRAVALADQRKAGLEKEAANAANALFEATKERATAAGAEMAKLASNLRYWQGQAMSADTDAAKAAADAQVVAIEAQVAELKLTQAAAQKEADRLEEANNNS